MFKSLIDNFKGKFQDTQTISELCLGAEKYANGFGEEKPAAEHFLLAALDLADGTANQLLSQFNIKPEQVKQALTEQHKQALQNIGIASDEIYLTAEQSEPVKPSIKPYDTTPSGQAVMQKIYQINKGKNTRLIGVHVLEAIVSMEQSLAYRVLQSLGVTAKGLKQALAESELTARPVD